MAVMSKVATPANSGDQLSSLTIVPLLIRRLAKQLPKSTGMSAEETMNEALFISTRDFLRQVVGRNLLSEMLEGYLGVLEDLAQSSGLNTALENRPQRILESILVITRLMADTFLREWDVASGQSTGSAQVFQASSKEVHDFYHGWMRTYDVFPPQVEGPLALRAIVFFTNLKSNTRVRNAVTRVFHDAYYESPYTLVTQIDMCIDVALWYLSASNWDEVYKFVDSRFRALANVQPDELDAFPHLDIFSLLYLNEDRLAALLRDVRRWISQIKRPVHARLVTHFIRQSMRYWIQTRPWEVVRAVNDSERSAVTEEAEALFDKLYKETNVAGNRVSSMWEMFVSLYLLIPESMQPMLDHEQTWIKRSQMLLGPMAPSSSKVSKKYSIAEELDKFLSSPNPRELAIAVGCYSIIGNIACFIRYLEPDSPIVKLACSKYEPMLRVLFQHQTAMPRYMNVDELQTNFATAYFILRGADFENDILALLDNQKLSLRLQRNILSGVLNVTLVRENIEPSGEKPSVPFNGAAAPTSRASVGSESGIGAKNLLVGAVLRRRESIVKLMEVHSQFVYQYDYGDLEKSASPAQYALNLDILKTTFALFTFCGERDQEIYQGIPESFSKAIVRCTISKNESLRTSTTETLYNFVRTDARQHSDPQAAVFPIFEMIGHNIEQSAGVLSSALSLNNKTVEKELCHIKMFLEIRCFILENYRFKKEFLRSQENSINSVTAALETALILTLCSPNIDICKLALDNMQSMVNEAIIFKELFPDASVVRNLGMYAELSSQSQFFTALAIQKKMFRLLQTIDTPSCALIKAWTIVYDRWTLLNARSSGSDLRDSDTRRQWRSYCGVACALLAPLYNLTAETKIPDNVHFKARQFLQDSLGFILSESDFVRETIREVLVSDIPLQLYQTVLQKLSEDVDRCLNDGTFGDSTGVKLLSETILLVRSIIERLIEEDVYVPVDMGGLAVKLTEHLQNAPDTAAYIKIRIRLCQLLESVGRAVNSFYGKHEAWDRIHVVMILAEWLERATALRTAADDTGSHRSRSDASSSLYRPNEEDWLIREKSVAISKALLRLLDGLEIEPPEDTHEKERMSTKFNTFNNLFSMFLRILHRCKTEEESNANESGALVIAEKIPYIRSQTIACLTQLLNSNVEFGLKVALPLAYHEDHSLRIAFLEIITSILSKGSKTSTGTGGHARELIVDHLSDNMQITSMLCDVCPAAEVDEFSVALLSTFDTRQKGLQLVEGIITREIENTSQGPDLLRRNCAATKILSIFAKVRGRHYLIETLKPFVSKVCSEPERYVFETSRATVVDDQENLAKFERCWDELTANLERTQYLIPEALHEVSQAIVRAVERVHPGFQFTAINSFFFLRFLCPALVAPEQEGIVEKALSPGERRALLTLAKDVQTIANVLSSNSEKDSSAPEIKRPIIEKLLTNFISQPSPPAEPESASTLSGTNAEDTVSQHSAGIGVPIADVQSFDVLHKFLYEHWDETQRRLLALLPNNGRKASVGSVGEHSNSLLHRRLSSISKEQIKEQRSASKERKDSHPGSAISTESELFGVLSVRKFAQLIRELGRPTIQSTTAAKNAPLIKHDSSRLYEFMERNSNRDLGPIIDQKVVTEGIATQGVPALIVTVRNFNERVADPDLMVYRFYQVASKLWANDFCIFYDLTGAKPENEIWGSIRSFREMLMPEEMAKRVAAVYYYNVPSWYVTAAKNDIKRYQAHGLYLHPQVTKYIFLTPENISQHVDVDGLNLQTMSHDVIDDARFQYHDTDRATYSTGERRMTFFPITMKLGSEFLQIHGVRAFHVGRISGYSNDVIRLDELKRVYVSETTGKPHEFTIEIGNNAKITLLNRKRNEIIRAIHNAKSRLPTTMENKLQQKDELVIGIEDAIGAFLNIGLTNICSTNSQLQEAAFNLLATIPQRFTVDFGRVIRGGKGLRIPKYEVTMAVSLSDAAAKSRPDLTSQFIFAFLKAFKSSIGESAATTVLYAAPWMENIYKHVFLASESGYQETVTIVRKLLDLTVINARFHSVFLLRVWPPLCLEPGLSELLVDEVVSFAVDRGIQQENIEDVLAVVTSFPTLSIAGTVLTKCRTLLSKPLSDERSLVNHPNWMEIVALVKLISVLSFESLVIVETYLPDIFFLVTSLLYSGDYHFRQALHSLVINVIHSFSCSSKLSHEQKERVLAVWNEMISSRGRLMFGLNDEMRDITYDYFVLTAITHIENCCTMLLDMLSIVGTVPEANVWRTRWSSFAMTACFVENPSLQCRSFLILGCLAKLDVEDVVVTRVLQVLRGSLLLDKPELVEDFSSCTLFCLSKMVDGLQEESNYVTRLFWISVALLVSDNAVVFNYAVTLMVASLKAMDNRGMLRPFGMPETLYNSLRDSDFSEVWPEVEKLLKVQFTKDHFDLALCYVVLKGVERATTKPIVLKALETFLELSSKNYYNNSLYGGSAKGYPPPFCCYLYFLYLVSPNPAELKDLLWIAGYPDAHIEAYTKDEMPRLLVDYLDADTLGSLLTLYIGGQLFCVCSEYDALGVRFLESLRNFKGKTSYKYMVYAMVRPRVIKLAAFGSQHPIMESMLGTAVSILDNREEFSRLAYHRAQFKNLLEREGFGATILDRNLEFPTVSKAPIPESVARLLVDLIEKTIISF